MYQPIYNPNRNQNNGNSFGQRGFRVINNNKKYYNYPTQQYDQINWFGLSFFGNPDHHRIRYLRNLYLNSPSSYESDYDKTIDKNIIKGIVLDENENPLPAATVNVKKSSLNNSTDFDGIFTLKAT